MPKKHVIEYDPVNNTYIDEAQLQTKTTKNGRISTTPAFAP